MNKLFDPQASEWDSTFRGDLDGMLILAHNDPLILARLASNERDHMRSSGINVVGEEPGYRLYNKGQSIEHFGYADGISNISFPKSSVESLQSHLIHGHPNHETWGSFLVFRKLEQNVLNFRTQVRRISLATGQGDALSGAYAMGRFQDGTPVVLSNREISAPNVDFDYGSDPNGARCPFQAHVRVSNPRRRRESVLIARRGMVYGARPDLHGATASVPPSSGVGLLFMCYQRDIGAQFEELQIRSNGRITDGPSRQDAVIGQGPSGELPPIWPLAYGDRNTVSLPFEHSVSLKGGEYFFAPNINYLESPV